MFGSDDEFGSQLPTQAQTIVEGSGAVLVSEYKPAPDVDYLQVCASFIITKISSNLDFATYNQESLIAHLKLYIHK